MRYGLQLYTGPTHEPVSLAEAKAHLRVTFSDEDALISELITAARQRVEEETYRALITQTWDLTLDELPAGEDVLRIPRAPLQEITSITYVDTSGDSQTLDADDYVVSATRQPGIVRPAYGLIWPDVRYQPDAVTVRFVAGYGDAAEVPAPIKAAIKLIVGQYYEFREELTERPTQPIPLGAQRIIQLYDLGDELLQYGSPV